MNVHVHWQLDVAAESGRGEPSLRPKLPAFIRDVRRTNQNRFDYYAQVAQGVAQSGFDGLYLPQRDTSDDTRIVAASLVRETQYIALIPEFPASVGSAVYAAKQAATFQRAARGRHGGRLVWAIAPDVDAIARAARGDHVDDSKLLQRLEEFLTVAQGVYQHKPFSFHGDFFEVENGGFDDPLNRPAFPAVWLQGEEDDNLALSARFADVHLFRPGKDLDAHIARLDALAGQAGRKLAHGLLQPVLARETDGEAAEEAARTDLPAGTVVGSYDAVADRLADLARRGIDHFVLSATPQLEEAYRIGQYLLPRLHTRLSGAVEAA